MAIKAAISTGVGVHEGGAGLLAATDAELQPEQGDGGRLRREQEMGMRVGGCAAGATVSATPSCSRESEGGR